MSCQPGGKPMDTYMRAAYEEAKKGMREGGIPIGSVLVVDGKIVGRGHNRRVQRGSPILHAEMDAFESAGRLKASGVNLEVLNDPQCIEMMEEFITSHPELWNEDIGE